MRIIKPSVEFFGAVPTDYKNALALIELAGRTCYKSEDKITEGGAEKFVRKLIAAGHLAMVEHSNFVVRKKYAYPEDADLAKLAVGRYITVVFDPPAAADTLYVGGNLTAWAQMCRSYTGSDELILPFLYRYGVLFDLVTDEFGSAFNEVAPALSGMFEVCPHNEIPKELHRYSAKFICDRGVSHELVRHRPCSFAQESTRYCNYSGKDMEFIEPVGFADWDMYQEYNFIDICSRSEKVYGAMLHSGLKPQQARAVLPNALKTEIVVTADSQEWAWIRKLRTSPAAHPGIQRLMALMPWEEFL